MKDYLQYFSRTNIEHSAWYLVNIFPQQFTFYLNVPSYIEHPSSVFAIRKRSPSFYFRIVNLCMTWFILMITVNILYILISYGDFCLQPTFEALKNNKCTNFLSKLQIYSERNGRKLCGACCSVEYSLFKCIWGYSLTYKIV